MDKIFEIAANIKTPLGLGGLIAVILFFVFKKILSAKGVNNRIVESIINKVFILALLALFLGVMAYFADKLHAPSAKSINATVFVDKNVKPGIGVVVLELEKEGFTNSFGRINLPYDFNKDYLTFKFTGFDTTLILANDSLKNDLRIYLSNAPPLTTEPQSAQLVQLNPALTPVHKGGEVKTAVKLLMPGDRERFTTTKYPVSINMTWGKVDWADFYELVIDVSSDNHQWSNDRKVKLYDTYFSYKCYWKNARWRVTAINRKQHEVSGWRTFSVRKPD